MRDPKVFWHAPTRRWVMSLACGDHIRLYTSPDLIEWTQASAFRAQHGSHAGVWECPDLFSLPIDGDADAQKWVLTVSLSGRIQYFIGQFTGNEFISENAKDVILWADFGRDIYAAVTWSDTSFQEVEGVDWLDGRFLHMPSVPRQAHGEAL